MINISSSDNVYKPEDVLIEEKIVLLNDNRERIGVANKLDSHHSSTPFHLAFSIYLFNSSGKLLATKRADSKKVWPGVWTNSCCGHPMPDESIVDAIKRRCRYEIGITNIVDISVILPNYEYKTPPFNNIIENEFCPVYAGIIDDDARLNFDEVSNYKWMDWHSFINSVKKNKSNQWSWWCKDQVKQLVDNEEIKRYFKN